MDKIDNGDGVHFHGTHAEIAQVMRQQIDAHKPHAMVCLDAAFELLYAVQTAPESIMPNGEPGTALNDLFGDCLRKLGREPTDEDIDVMYLKFVTPIYMAGGMTLDAAWVLGHFLEQLTWRALQ